MKNIRENPSCVDHVSDMVPRVRYQGKDCRSGVLLNGAHNLSGNGFI